MIRFGRSAATRGGATKAQEDAKAGRLAKGRSSQVIQRKAGSGGRRDQREERRQ